MKAMRSCDNSFKWLERKNGGPLVIEDDVCNSFDLLVTGNGTP